MSLKMFSSFFLFQNAFLFLPKLRGKYFLKSLWIKTFLEEKKKSFCFCHNRRLWAIKVLQYTFLVIYIRLYRKQQRTAQDDVYRYITRRSIIVDSRLDILSTIVVRIMHAIQSIQRWCEESDFSSWHENFNKSLIEIYIKECCAFYVTWHSSQRDFFQVGSLLNPTRHQFKTRIWICN